MKNTTHQQLTTNKRAFKPIKLMRFNDDAKTKFLDLYRDLPNITKVAVQMGINRRTITKHLKDDELFKMAFQEVVEAINDDLEEYMVERAKSKGGFMDRIAYLKAHRTKFQDRIKHEHTQNRASIDNLYDKIPKAQVIDTTLDNSM